MYSTVHLKVRVVKVSCITKNISSKGRFAANL